MKELVYSRKVETCDALLGRILDVADRIRNSQRKLRRATSAVHNRAAVCVAAAGAGTMDTIQKLKWNVLPHPPYSPDLAPSDYHFFGPLKEHLGGKRFRNNEEVIQSLQEWVHWQPKGFFLSGIRKLTDRWRKCIANQGDYVEKWQFQFRRINQSFCSIYEL